MSSIRSVGHQSYQMPKTSKSGEIADLKMQISKVHQKEQLGFITKEQADMEIAGLESKIAALEIGSADALNNEQVQDFSIPQDNPKQETCNQDSIDRQDAYFNQQATYNKALHGLN